MSASELLDGSVLLRFHLKLLSRLITKLSKHIVGGVISLEKVVRGLGFHPSPCSSQIPWIFGQGGQTPVLPDSRHGGVSGWTGIQRRETLHSVRSPGHRYARPGHTLQAAWTFTASFMGLWGVLRKSYILAFIDVYYYHWNRQRRFRVSLLPDFIFELLQLQFFETSDRNLKMILTVGISWTRFASLADVFLLFKPFESACFIFTEDTILNAHADPKFSKHTRYVRFYRNVHKTMLTTSRIFPSDGTMQPWEVWS